MRSKLWEETMNQEIPIKEIDPPFLKELQSDLETIKNTLHKRLLNINKDIRAIPISNKKDRKTLKEYSKETDIELNKARNLIIKVSKLKVKDYEEITKCKEEYLAIKDNYYNPKNLPNTFTHLLETTNACFLNTQDLSTPQQPKNPISNPERLPLC